MSVEKYNIEFSIKSKYFEFISSGINGNIVKIVKYTLLKNHTDVYNLGFGDKNMETGEIDDTAISNNGDTEKVLVL